MTIAAVMGIDPTAVADTPEFQLGQLGAIIDAFTNMFNMIQAQARWQQSVVTPLTITP